MKPYFQRCHYCGSEQPLNDLEQFDNGFIVCKDVIACNKRVERSDMAYYNELGNQIEKTQATLNELIHQRENLRKMLGLPDAALERHKAELAKIEMEG